MDYYGQQFDIVHCKRLLGELCNDTITEPGLKDLTDLLSNHSEARRLYRDYLMVHVKLMDMAMVDLTHGEQPKAPPVCTIDTVAASCSASAPSEKLTPKGGGWKSKLPSPSNLPRLEWALSLAATLLLAAAWVVSDWANPPKQDSSVASASHTDKKLRGDALSSPDLQFYVAQITGLTPDVRWGNSSTAREFLLRLRCGDYVEIESGVLELTYFSGAQVLLHGPCVFVPTGESSGKLLRGDLTGNVTVGDFVLTTPTAEVLDLGTEFGVTLGESGSTSVCVFDGKVRVSEPEQGTGGQDSLLLLEGMAAHVDQIDGIKPVTDIDTERFVRSLPLDAFEDNSISLVNLLNGVQQYRFRLAGVLAPDTGESDRQPWLRVDGPGYSLSKGFQRTDWHPFVDGVFIPSKSGRGTQVDTAGHMVDLPQTTGRTWGPVWSRSRAVGAMATKSSEDFWGAGSLESVAIRLERCQVGMIGTHANVGVTFDLAAVRTYFEKSPQKFTAAISNLNNARKRSPEWAASYRFNTDLRVYIDGELREDLLDFSDLDGELMLEVNLESKDRFLTIVTTNAGEDEPHMPDANDHVVIIDPILHCTDLF